MDEEEARMWLYDMIEEMRLGLVIMPASGRLAALEVALEVMDADAIPKKSLY